MSGIRFPLFLTLRLQVISSRLCDYFNIWLSRLILTGMSLFTRMFRIYIALNAIQCICSPKILNIFFIHSSVDGYLDCFHVLDIINSAAMNIGFMCLVELWFSQGTHVIGLLGHQFSSVAQSCLTLCNPMDCSIPALLVYHQL